MLKCMMHEPFYTSGRQSDIALGVSVGWVSQQGSFSDCMPLWNKSHDVCLILSGEVYADEAEIRELRVRRPEVATDNASYLIHLYEEFGIKFVEKLNGLFSGVLLDRREQRVVLFNDRYGLNRIFFHEKDGIFYFSSEAKSLLKVLPELRSLDPKSLAEFFSCSCILQNRTVFLGISLLPGGSAWTFSPDGESRKQSYFRSESWENQIVLSHDDYYERLKEMWPRILSRYFRGPEKMALSLTGGVDSRMILAWAPGLEGTLPCYTFGGTYRDCRDVKIARAVAEICRQPHRVISIGSEFLSEFPALAEKMIYISDGSMDLSGTIDLYLQRKARQIAPVRVTGTYGGEILRSLVVFKPNTVCERLLDEELTRQSGTVSGTYAAELEGKALSFSAFKQTAWYMACKFVIERSQLTVRMPYFDNDLIALAYQAPPEAQTNALSLKLVGEKQPALNSIGTDRGAPLNRSPALARAYDLWQQFTFKAEYAYDYGMPQWLARADHIFAPLRLERLFLGRHKFHHFRVFYRDQLAPYVKEVLLDSRTRTRPFWRAKYLEKMVSDHVAGVGNHTLEIHKILAVELLQRLLLEQN